jgi:hypothetical protein
MAFLLFLLPQLLSGGSVDGAAYLAEGKADIAFNWSGEHSSSQQATKLHASQANIAAVVVLASWACTKA